MDLISMFRGAAGALSALLLCCCAQSPPSGAEAMRVAARHEPIKGTVTNDVPQGRWVSGGLVPRKPLDACTARHAVSPDGAIRGLMGDLGLLQRRESTNPAPMADSHEGEVHGGTLLAQYLGGV